MLRRRAAAHLNAPLIEKLAASRWQVLGMDGADRRPCRFATDTASAGSASGAIPWLRTLREAFGTVAYGFFPARAMAGETAARLIHSADERVPVDNLELGVRFLRHAAVTVCGAGAD